MVLSLRVQTIKRTFDNLSTVEQLSVLQHISPQYDYLALDLENIGEDISENDLKDNGIILKYNLGNIKRYNCTTVESKAIEDILEPRLNSVLVMKNTCMIDAQDFLEISSKRRLIPFKKENFNMGTLCKVLTIVYFDIIQSPN